MTRALAWLVALALAFGAPGLVAAGCGVAQMEVRGAPPLPFDALIVPGCPAEDDGRLSRCQLARAIYATLLYERGWTRNVIVSGAAVHTPYVEAEALAAAMAALGVPGDHIWLEPNALHTDENMFYSLQIARAKHWTKLAVASQHGHAGWSCRMLADWGQPCSWFAVDLSAVEARHAAVGRALDDLRVRRVVGWVDLPERERALARATGRPPRPPSFLLYPWLGWLRLNHERWTPPAPPTRLANWNTFHSN